jgi:hypothetical protein
MKLLPTLKTHLHPQDKQVNKHLNFSGTYSTPNRLITIRHYIIALFKLRIQRWRNPVIMDFIGPKGLGK